MQRPEPPPGGSSAPALENPRTPDRARAASGRLRLPVVGVLGSGTAPHAERARAVGQWLAHEGVHLLTGGGAGVMEAVSRAFFEVPDRRGAVIGILPGSADGAIPGGYPNPWVEIAISTHLPLSGERGTDALSRNHINVLSSDVLLALPGGAGTASEVRLALRYGRPL
ncbi:MAG: SLOG cluster 4 domain-containing protein, partial [Planctomycetota bacterium]